VRFISRRRLVSVSSGDSMRAVSRF
jgi:hypothetical protein